MKRLHIYFDGATKGSNPTLKIGWGVVYGEEELMGCYALSGGNLTNNMAEYYGLLLALRTIQKKKPKEDIVIYSDSQMLVSQMNGLKEIRMGSYTGLAKTALRILREVKEDYNVQITWIARENNTHADKLSKKALTL